MKKKVIIKTVLCLYIPLLFIACEKTSLLSPKASITINQQQFTLNESMVINFMGVADQVVIYTGDNQHDYELRNQGNTGFVVNKDLFNYAYSVPGTYKVVCVVSIYDNLAIDLLRDTCSYVVTVVDDNTEIERLSCPQILYDEVFAERLTNDEWLMKLPRKVKYNNVLATISLSQRLQLYIASGLANVTIDGKEFEERTKYDFSTPVNILVRSNYGTERLYMLYTIQYPEFATFRLADVEGTLERNAYDYSTFDMLITLPVGTDVSNLTPEFTTTSAMDKVYIQNAEQISGTSIVNFTEDITYQLVSTFSLDHQDKRAMSTINVKINYQ